MVLAAFTIKLQSPSYNNTGGQPDKYVDSGTGRQIPLPVRMDSHTGQSLAAIITLFAGENIGMDFGQLKEVIRLTGTLTPLAATDAGFGSPTHWRDVIRRTRGADPYKATPWSLETASGNWGTASLPAAEQDTTETRTQGKCRLIFDKRWAEAAGDPQWPGSPGLVNLFLYGMVMDFSFPNRLASANRDVIPFGLTFGVTSVAIT